MAGGLIRVLILFRLAGGLGLTGISYRLHFQHLQQHNRGAHREHLRIRYRRRRHDFELSGERGERDTQCKTRGILFSYLSEHLNEDVTQVNLVISGTRSVAVMYEREIIDLLRKGQSVLNILPLAGFKDELDSTIIELYPEGRATTGMPTATVAEG